MDWLDLLAVQGTLKSLLHHHSLKASILRRSAFFTVQLSYPYMTTGKTIALTIWTCVGKIMSLLFNRPAGPGAPARMGKGRVRELHPCGRQGNKEGGRYFGHLMRRVGSFEKTLMLGRIGGRRRRGRQRMRWHHRLDGCESE